MRRENNTYNRPFSIVDEEEIDDKFIPGTGVTFCPDCGKECNIKHNITEYLEYIFCSSCIKKFVRKRSPVFENEYRTERQDIITTKKEEKNEYVEFRCERCNTENMQQEFVTHEKTRPEGDFHEIETGIMKNPQPHFRCPCGKRHYGMIDIGEKITCDCGRVFALSMSEINKN